ncbi:L,D-transpeptidase [Brevundimonas sp.]|uniref:L,D-transpeptidase n=1 Tax=Brevundimonas sp. TaxID=1871086 RepID=UPI003D6C9A1E
MFRLFGAAVLFVAALTSGDVFAQGRPESSSVELARAADSLAPGQWVWAPEIAPAGPLLVYVNLSDQIATVYRNGVRIGVSTVSSGKPGHETPTGVFTTLQKDADHRSSLYNNAPMFYMERLTGDGVALHAGGLPGYPESHGCVHLPLAFARLLYGETSLGATVVVAGDAATHVGAPPGGVATPFSADRSPQAAAQLDAQPWRWTPELSPVGPMTIVLSTTDQVAVVLRNGVEIGRSPIRLADDAPAVRVLTLVQDAANGDRWIYAALPGNDRRAGQALEPAALDRLHAPLPFYTAVRSALRSGDTILITPSPVGEHTTGRRMTILNTEPGQ